MAALKQTLIRIAPLLERSVVNGVFTQEDRFYVGECVRRYLPDTLPAYLQVPAQQRAIPGPDGHSASALLIAQIKTWQTELSQREALLVQQANEALHQ